MSCADSLSFTRLLSLACAIAMASVALSAQSIRGASPTESSAGRLASSCGVPPVETERLRDQVPVFPLGQYPVKLPAVSMLGAHNDLPNPYQLGVDWGQLPAGRKWGSTASVTTGLDGTIWVTDRCGNFGSGGASCAGASANVNPIFQFDPSGKLLKSFGAGLFINPHKLVVD